MLRTHRLNIVAVGSFETVTNPVYYSPTGCNVFIKHAEMQIVRNNIRSEEYDGDIIFSEIDEFFLMLLWVGRPPCISEYFWDI